MAVAKKKCKHCGEYEYQEKGVKHPVGFFCTQDHAILFAQDKASNARVKSIAKFKQVQAKKERAVNDDYRARKLATKPKSKTLSEAQAAFNKYIRIRDYFEPCISCGKSREEVEQAQGWKVGGCWDAGHFMTRGAKGQLRFVLYNVHKQCKSCNGGSGKFSSKAATVDKNYRINLIKKIGLAKVECLKNSNDIDLKKNDVEYLNRVKRIFNKRARFYEKRRMS